MHLVPSTFGKASMLNDHLVVWLKVSQNDNTELDLSSLKKIVHFLKTDEGDIEFFVSWAHVSCVCS